MSDIFSGSLLDVAGIFVAVLQERFKEEGVPWRWSEKYARTDDQDATVSAPAAIAIGSVYAEEDVIRDALPRIVVSVPQANLNMIGVGNRASIRQSDRTEIFTAFDVMAVVIECRGKTPGEALTIADIARTSIAYSKNAIRELFKFHDITLPSTSDPKEVKDYHVANISFQVTVQVKWKTRPIAPRLQEIALRIDAGEGVARDVALYGDFTR